VKKQAVRVDLWERMQFAKAAQRERMDALVEKKVEDEGEKKVGIRILPYNPESELPHCLKPKGWVWKKGIQKARRRYSKFQAKGAPSMQTNDIIPPGS